MLRGWSKPEDRLQQMMSNPRARDSVVKCQHLGEPEHGRILSGRGPDPDEVKFLIADEADWETHAN